MSANGGEREASLIVDSELRELARVNAWVHEWTAHQQLPPDMAHNIDLCTTELEVYARPRAHAAVTS